MRLNKIVSLVLSFVIIWSILPWTAIETRAEGEAVSEAVEALAPEPTPEPTAVPTPEPTPEPTPKPTQEPTAAPTPEPTAVPTPEPTEEPTPEPTAVPTPESTAAPTPKPSSEESAAPGPIEEPVSQPAEEPEALFDSGYALISKAETPVREQAKNSAEFIAYLSKDDIVFITRRIIADQAKPGKDWLECVFDTSDGVKKGYVRAEDVEPQAEPEQEAEILRRIERSGSTAKHQGHLLMKLDCKLPDAEAEAETSEDPQETAEAETSEESQETAAPDQTTEPEETPDPEHSAEPEETAVPEGEQPEKEIEFEFEGDFSEEDWVTMEQGDEEDPLDEQGEPLTIIEAFADLEQNLIIVAFDQKEEEIAFPMSLKGIIGESVYEVTVTAWLRADAAERVFESGNTYEYAPQLELPEGYALAEDIGLPVLRVEVKAQDGLSLSLNPMLAKAGDRVTLRVAVTGYEGAGYQWQWAQIPVRELKTIKARADEAAARGELKQLVEELAVEGEAAEALSWQDEAGAAEVEYSFEASADNMDRYWRMALVLPEGQVSSKAYPSLLNEGKEYLREGGWRYIVNDEGFAEVVGYSDFSAIELTIPLSLGGYDVTAIGEKAFVQNIALKRLRVHGNVRRIADDACEGLGSVSVIAYNGAEALAYAAREGLTARNLSEFSFVPQLIDYTDIKSERFSYAGNNTIRMNKTEALRLSEGAVFHLPEAYGRPNEAFKVLTIVPQDERYIIYARPARAGEVLTELVVSEINMQPDWSQAVYADGISPVSGSSSRGMMAQRGTGGIGTTVNVDVTIGKIKVKGELDLRASLDSDIDIGFDWFKVKVNKLEVVAKYSAKGKLAVEFKHEQDSLKRDAQGVVIPLAKVPISSVSGITAYVDIFIKVSISVSGEITINVASESGTRWSAARKEFESFNRKVDNEIKGKLKGELSVTLVGEVNIHVFALGDILAIGVEVKYSISIEYSTLWCRDMIHTLKINVYAKTKGILDGLSVRTNLNIKFSFELNKTHYCGDDWTVRKECIYKKYVTVSFYTKTKDHIPDQRFEEGGQIDEPKKPIVKGNKFLGWFTDQSLTEEWDFNNIVKTDMTLYAGWSLGVKTVQYVVGQQGLDDFTQEVVPGSLLLNTSPILLVSYILDGWYTDAAHTKKWNFKTDTMPNHDLTLYANWIWDPTHDPFKGYDDADVFEIQNGVLIKYSGDAKDVIIPKKIGNQEVKNVSGDAFAQNTIVETIVLPDTAEYISGKFEGCSNLREVTLPNGLVGFDAKFHDCNKLKKIIMPSTVRSSLSNYSRNDMFQNCASLEEIVFSPNIYPTSWGSRMIWNCPSLKKVILPRVEPEVGTLPSFAFENCSSLESIIIPEGVQRIGYEAFRGCSSLKNITLPKELEAIAEGAFSGCSSLESIRIPTGVTKIERGTFSECSSLKTVILHDGITSIGAGAFSHCSSLETIVLPKKINEISSSLFSGCTKLKNITMPDKITKVGGAAFHECEELMTIALPGDEIEIEMFAFENCSSLESVYGNIISVELQAFMGCDRLKNISLKNASYIESEAFSGCSNLSNMVFHPGLTEIDALSFYQCSSIEELCFPEQTMINTIGFSAFEGCTNLKKIHWPYMGKTLSVDNNSFANCPNLQTVYGYPGSGVENFAKQRGYTFIPIGTDVKAVRFFSNGGTYTASREYAVGSFIDKEPVTVRDGYNFTGWYTDEGCTNLWDFNRDKVPNYDIALYAGWTMSASQFEYSTKEDSITIIRYKGRDSFVSVPEIIENKPVRSISTNAFWGLDHIVKISIPSSVTSISSGAFSGAVSVNEVVVSDLNPSYVVCGGVLMSSDKSTLLYCPPVALKNIYILPESVISVADYAFMDCRLLTQIIMPNVESIGAYAFMGCENLDRLTLPDTLMEIGEFAFLECPVNLYGPVGVSVAKEYADKYFIGYNVYEIEFVRSADFKYIVSYEAGTLIDRPVDVAAKDKHFLGWFTEQWISSDQWDFDTDTMPEEKVTLYAMFKDDYLYKQQDGKVIITSYQGVGGDITIPEAIDGRSVSGIATNAIISRYDRPITSVTIPSGLTIEIGAISGTPGPLIIGDMGSSAETYAVGQGLGFQVKQYMVNLDSNGGAWHQAFTAAAGEKLNLPIPVRDNHYFIGWYQEDGIIWNAEASYMPGCDIVLTAKWNIVNANIDPSPYKFQDNGNSITIVSYNGSERKLEIPNKLHGKPVTKIEAQAFYGCDVQDLVIPVSVQEIGESAFENSELIRIHIGSGVKTIGKNAFADCGGLTDIIWEGTVTDIPEGCFRDCTSLMEVNLSQGVVSVGDNAFDGCVFLKKVVLPSTLTYVAETAFDGCTRLEEITVIGGGDYATKEGVLYTSDGMSLVFYPAGRKDSEYIVPDNTLFIGDRSFAGNRYIQSITFPKSLTWLGVGAMENCIGLRSVIFHPNTTINAIQPDAFSGCYSLKYLSLPDQVSSIGADAFYGCSQLSGLYIPPAAASISSTALDGCDQVKIFGEKGSIAQMYAESNNILFVAVGGNNDGYEPNVSLTAFKSLILGEASEGILATATLYNYMPGFLSKPFWRLEHVSGNAASLNIDNAQDESVSINYRGVTAVGTVQYELICTVGEAQAIIPISLTVTGQYIPAEEIRLSAGTKTLQMGETFSIGAEVLPQNATDKVINWASEDEGIATVNGEGLVTAVGAGSTKIKASISLSEGGEVSAICAVKVEKANLSLNATVKSLLITKTFTLQATLMPSSAAMGEITWESSNPAVATVDESGVVTAVKAGTATITAMVALKGGGEATASCTVYAADFKLNAAEKFLLIGKSFTLKGTTTPSAAAEGKVSFKSSNAAVATVSSSGAVKGVKKGTVTITATVALKGGGTATAKCIIYVQTGTLSLNETTKTLLVGKTFTLVGTSAPSGAASGKITWKSSNTKIATVSASGVVKGIKAGTATITATVNINGGGTATAKSTVYVAGFTLNTTGKTLASGESFALQGTLNPASLKEGDISWKSSNTTVATVDEGTGLVTAKGPGSATITATVALQGGETATAACAVYVFEGFSLNAEAINLAVGKSFTLKGTLMPPEAANGKVTWKSSNTKIATVSAAGVVKGIKAGTATITATVALKGGGTATATCEVYVMSGLKLNTTTKTLLVENTHELKATLTPSSAAKSDIRWISSDETVASVDASGSTVTVKGNKAGTATITATVDLKGGGVATAKCTVYVREELNLNAEEINLTVGKSFTLKAKPLTPPEAANGKVTWKSSNTKIATVSASGVVKGIKAGTATITATVALKGGGTATATCAVYVMSGLKLNTTTKTLLVGEPHPLTGTLTPSSAAKGDIRWISSDETVASVDEVTGYVTANGPGSATITATVELKGGGEATAKSVVTVTEFMLNASATSVKVKKTFTLTGTIAPSIEAEGPITWKSSNSKIATVSASGVVKGVKAGKATVTATVILTDGRTVTAKCVVTVK